MEWQEVKSGHIHFVGYDKATKTLGVTFRNGRSYEYEGVHPDVHQEMLKAESLGKYFNTNVRHVFQTKAIDHPKE